MSRPNLLTPEFIEASSPPVPDAGCWLWNGYIRKDGYGHLRSMNKKILAHRASFIAHNGSIEGGFSVLHKCDTPSCVNPEHLVLGTYEDNNKDRARKGRSALGERSGKCKLSDRQVLEIKESTESRRQLALAYGVSYAYVKDIKRGAVRIIPQLSRYSSV